MSLGLDGPITALTEYALSRTYQIRSATRNAIRCRCKGCGQELPKGHGSQVWIVSHWSARLHPYYFCRSCLRPVKEAYTRFPLEVPEPKWWPDLDKPIERTRTHRDPLPAEELDRLIEAREQRNKS